VQFQSSNHLHLGHTRIMTPRSRLAVQVKSISLPTGVTIEYAEQGTTPCGTPVVFLHGVTDSWRSFEGVLAHLPLGLRAYALSQRGHGNSSRPEAGHLYHHMARDLRAFIDALRLPPAVVVDIRWAPWLLSSSPWTPRRKSRA
jgi:alpha-beta hydrolase superfamily lysophospholipase